MLSDFVLFYFIVTRESIIVSSAGKIKDLNTSIEAVKPRIDREAKNRLNLV